MIFLLVPSKAWLLLELSVGKLRPKDALYFLDCFVRGQSASRLKDECMLRTAIHFANFIRYI